MKRLLICFLCISVGFNIYFLLRKIERIERNNELRELNYFKEISYEEGYTHFTNQLATKYPETIINNKYYIVYMWDSLMYGFLNKYEMKSLDSIAAIGNYKIEYVFATEMEEKASENFLKRQKAEYKNVKMLYDMDDYISGLYHNPDVKLIKSKQYFSKNTSEEDKEKFRKEFSTCKRKPFYIIMDSKGKVLFNTGKHIPLLKDSLFFKKLPILSTNKKEILN